MFGINSDDTLPVCMRSLAPKRSLVGLEALVRCLACASYTTALRTSPQTAEGPRDVSRLKTFLTHTS